MKNKHLRFPLALLLLVLVPSTVLGSSRGARYLFPDKQFHFQTLRTLDHGTNGGAMTGEVLSLIPRISDDESWKRKWLDMAEKCEAWAGEAADPVSKGNDLLRASNYYRTAAFFLPPRGEDLGEIKKIHQKSVRTFQNALKSLGINHRIYQVPWESGHMLVYYFPGKQDKPLMFVHGGFDSTLEEVYFLVAAAFIERGYPVVMFEGPGQSNMIREFGIRFTPDWHKPVAKVMDFMLSTEPGLAGKKKVLVGMSFGGLLAGRAAAYEPRFDGAVLWGAPYDMKSAALFQMPAIGRWAYRQGMRGSINMGAGLISRWDRNLRWGLNNGMWTIGGDTPYDMLKAFEAYTLADVQDKIRCHVLCLYGEKDIYVSDDSQLNELKNSFKHAASYTLKIFKEEDGSAEHCQNGAKEQAMQEIMLWLDAKGLNAP